MTGRSAAIARSDNEVETKPVEALPEIVLFFVALRLNGHQIFFLGEYFNIYALAFRLYPYIVAYNNERRSLIQAAFGNTPPANGSVNNMENPQGRTSPYD